MPSAENDATAFREALIEKIARLDYWGARGLGPARHTARNIVDMLVREGYVIPPGATDG